jgi:hypothetical protein
MIDLLASTNAIPASEGEYGSLRHGSPFVYYLT